MTPCDPKVLIVSADNIAGRAQDLIKTATPHTASVIRLTEDLAYVVKALATLAKK